MANTRSRSAGDPSSNTVRQTIVETVEAPRLEGITTADFVKFKQEREVYERRIAEKNSDTNFQVQLTSYRDSIEEAILEIFALGDWVPVDDPDQITEEHLKDCIARFAVVDPNSYDLGRLEDELKGFVMEKADSEHSIESRVWSFVLEYSKILKKNGYEKFTERHPKIAVGHLLKRIAHPHLLNRMLLTAKLKKEDEFRKNYKAFVRELAAEAKILDRMHAARRYQPTVAETDEFAPHVTGAGDSHRTPRAAGHRGRRKNKGANVRDDGNGDKEPSDRNTEKVTGKKEKTLPVCFNPKCGNRHYVKDCPISTEAEKDKFLEEYREQKRAKKGGKTVGAVARQGADSDHSSLFMASFCDGSVASAVLADQGSDTNLISPSVLKAIVQANPSIEVKRLVSPVEFSNASARVDKICCSREVTADVLMRIRHGKNLMMRGVKWLVSDHEVQFVFIGWHVLSSLGLNNRILLAAAADRHNGEVDIPDLLRKDGHDDAPCTGFQNSVHNILRDRSFEYGSTFHSEGGAEPDYLEDSNTYIDLGEDSPLELGKAIADMIAEARKHGLSESGAERLKQIIDRYPVFDFGWEKPNQPTYHL